jgi:hypothetical protein
MCFGNPKGVSWLDWINTNGRWALLLAPLLFLFLALRQLRIWNVSAGENEIYLKRFLGSKKIILQKKDMISFDVELDIDPSWMKNPRNTIVVKLQTTQGEFTFNSSDYKLFDSTLNKLFSQNKEMRTQCFGQISRLKNKAGI